MTINLDDEQRPYGHNYFNVFEPVPVESGGRGAPVDGKDNLTGAGDSTAGRQVPRGNPRVHSAILGEAAQEVGDLGVHEAGGLQRDVESENLRDADNLESSNTDSQKLSGIAVIDGRHAQRPAKAKKSKDRAFKQFVQGGGAGEELLVRSDRSSEDAALQDDVVFSNMVIDARPQHPSNANKDRVLNQSRARRSAKALQTGTPDEAAAEAKAAEDAQMVAFTSSMPVSDSLIGILNLSKTVQLDDAPAMKQYIRQKGVPLLDSVGEQLDTMARPFDKQTKARIENVDSTSGAQPLAAQHIKGEKFTEHRSDDF